MREPDSSLPPLDHLLQQIGTELAVLSIGSNEGLVPLFALTNEILERKDLDAAWVAPMEYVQKLLDGYMEDGRPVDASGLKKFSTFGNWLSEAATHAQLDEPISAFSESPQEGANSAQRGASPLAPTLRRIFAETQQLTVGSDEGLIPLFSLSSELLDSPHLTGVWAAALEAMQEMLEIYLDEGRPIDQKGVERFAAFQAWLATAIENENSGGIILPWAQAGTPKEDRSVTPSPADHEPAPIRNPVVGADEEILVVDPSNDVSLLKEFFQEAVEHLDSIEGHLLTLEAQPQDPEGLAAVFRAMHTVKGVAGFLHLKPIQRLAHHVESLLDLARNNEIVLNAELFTLILESGDQLKAMTNIVGLALQNGAAPETHFPISDLVKRIEAATRLAQEKPGERMEAADEKPEPSATKGAKAGLPAPGGTAKAKAHTIRVASERINSLMDVVGELVILESQLMQSAKPFVAGNTALQRQFSQLQRILKDLQHTSMALQMVPIKPTFQRVERIVRDLSQKLNKKITLEVEGEETELDRTVVELITDPLVHMIRNAVDHGLETTEDRLKAGKDPVGKVQLKAYHLGSSIVVELSDDGHGIDPEKIRNKAIESGILSPETQLTHEETLQLIFAPGFSTATVLTENSGRGVGMDVVKRNVDAMRGSISVHSEVGKGSTFKVKLPLTTAIIDGLIVRVGADKYIIPTHAVQVTMRPEKKQLVKIGGSREMVVMRDRTVPLIRLNRLLGINQGEEDPTKASLAIVESFGKQYAIMVDEMINKQEVVIKNLGQVLGKLPGIAGGAILGDGSIALILDPAALAKHEAA
jgi:two-component system chemotaxis sensor kinase CheA